MWLGLVGILIIAWIISFLVLHVSSGLIHLLLLFAAISFVLNLFTNNKTTT